MSRAELHSERQQTLERTLTRCGYRRVNQIGLQLPQISVRKPIIVALLKKKCKLFRLKGRSELNGKTGVVQKYLPTVDRFIFQLSDTEERIKVKVFNLKNV
mmetsp:Transcript_16690/g.29115  ORF Transcript_16690/g.29115 Transcript_16690/m.29115 type:complete len:101 (-) Transcript_16690:794-1096(-)